MADLTVYVLMFAALVAVYGRLRSKTQSLDRGRFFKTSQEWLQGKLASMTRQNSPQNTTSKTSPASILPPSIQFALPGHTSSLALHDSEATVLENQIDMSADYKSCHPRQYTPTGISIEEIKQFSNFPDYASLSEVPLPNSYPEFDIDRALPRPYRPFRWNYHQTMCMSVSKTPPSSVVSLFGWSLTLRSSIKDGHRLVDRAREHVSPEDRRAESTPQKARQNRARLSSWLGVGMQRAFGNGDPIPLCSLSAIFLF